MLKPLKGLPFPVIVKALAGNQVIQIDRNSKADELLVKKIERAIQFCAAELRSKPIRRRRPNEVGNDIEPYVMRALQQSGLTAARPRDTHRGQRSSSGCSRAKRTCSLTGNAGEVRRATSDWWCR